MNLKDIDKIYILILSLIPLIYVLFFYKRNSDCNCKN